MREASGLFLILVGTAFLWVAIHGYSGAGLPGIFEEIFGAIERA